MKGKTLKRTDLVASRHINIEKDSLPVDVRPSEKSLLKLPYTFIGASELEVLQAIYNRNTFFATGVSVKRGVGVRAVDGAGFGVYLFLKNAVL